MVSQLNIELQKVIQYTICEIKDIAEVLGHRRIETTEKYYITSTEVDKNEVIKLFENSIRSNVN